MGFWDILIAVFTMQLHCPLGWENWSSWNPRTVVSDKKLSLAAKSTVPGGGLLNTLLTYKPHEILWNQYI